ncbi:protein of unknown function [Bradyrhizobium vignae]|uniref:Uncharacterized protein n=1 Tax=Bradyrhizobium vignae TaxID=1549949 RepID=A0A2U3PSF0_9BRAD|nr:protein of unknown function [Bradyrhizobium vignae]
MIAGKLEKFSRIRCLSGPSNEVIIDEAFPGAASRIDLILRTTYSAMMHCQIEGITAAQSPPKLDDQFHELAFQLLATEQSRIKLRGPCR